MGQKYEERMTSYFPSGQYPKHVGEYPTIVEGSSIVMLRWWDGEEWSIPYSPLDTKRSKSEYRSLPAMPELQRCIGWCGLAEKPKAKRVQR
jgi:hypothetical protein